MRFVQRDDMIEDLAPATTDPAFRYSVLPWRLHARLLGLHTRRLQEGHHPGVELRVTIEDRVAIRAGLWERLAHLLDDPRRRRVTGDVEMQDLPSPMLDDEEALQQLERHRGHGEEVEGNDHLAMILEEGQRSSYPDSRGDGSNGDTEARFVPRPRNRAFEVRRGSSVRPSLHSLLPSGGRALESPR